MNDSQQQAVPAFFSLMRAYINDQHRKNFENEEDTYEEESEDSSSEVTKSYNNSDDLFMSCLDVMLSNKTNENPRWKNLTDDADQDQIKNEIRSFLTSKWQPSDIYCWVDLCNRLNGWSTHKVNHTWEHDKKNYIFNGFFKLGNLASSSNDLLEETQAHPYAYLAYIAIGNINAYLIDYNSVYKDVDSEIRNRTLNYTKREEEINKRLSELQNQGKSEEIEFRPVIIQCKGSDDWLIFDPQSRELSHIDLTKIPERYIKCDAPACIVFYKGHQEFSSVEPYMVSGKTFKGGPKQNSSESSNEETTSKKAVYKYETSSERNNSTRSASQETPIDKSVTKFLKLKVKSVSINISGKQTGGSDCLVAATKFINEYLEKKHPSYSLPPEGDPRDAHVTIKTWGKESKSSQMTTSDKHVTWIQTNKEAAAGAINYINHCLNKDIPVLVGLNYRERTYTNNDGVTDHFSIIKGKKNDRDGRLCYILHDVNGGDDVTMYVEKDNDLIVAAPDVKKPYQVSQVRVYPQDLDSFEDIAKTTRRVADKDNRRIRTA